MRAHTKRWSLSVFGLLGAWLASPAHAAGAPLLVVVEAPANVNVDAEEVRRAIGNELGIETVSPTRPAGAAPDRTLVVAIEHDHIAMSLRTATGAPLARTIDTPADHAERLRAIAWLAGNLVRDQVGPLIAAASVAAPPVEPSVTVTSAGAEASSFQPPPAATVPSTNATATPTISTRAPSDGPPQGWGWAVGAGWGSTIGVWGRGPTNVFGAYDAARGNAWHADVQSRLDGGEIILGLTIEGTTGSYNPQLFGALAFVGAAWPRRFFSVEATIGLGIEELQTLNYNFMATTTVDGTNYTIGTGRPHLVPYARLNFAVVVPVVNGFSALLSLGGHATGEFYDGWFGEGTLGLRYTFQ